MPTRHSHSRSPARRDSRSPDSRTSREKLPNNASPISEDDYFQKSDEFRSWLKDEKGKYFDELSGDRARSYFRKFVKAWNRGKLPKSLYAGLDPSTIAATSQTAYKWSFASKKTRADDEALRNAKQQITAATYHLEDNRPSKGRVLGPTLPSTSDRALAREETEEQEREERTYKRKRDKLEAKERIEDMVGPREVGREGMLEKKRARRDADRNFREKGDEGLEADESTLLGGGDSFQAHIARRDAGKRRFEAKKDEKTAEFRERASQMREKEKATMDMFQQMAKRFG